MATATILCALPAPARSDEPDARARDLAATCSTCHTSSGAADPSIPPLAGAPAAVTAQKMREFKSGARNGTVMPQLARGYSDAQIDAIAGWLAQRRR